ncbi:DNA replication/repair protein RecF [Sphingomonas humi]|uniref:DNA replication and repair protein RecF n=1 Tax=Sphingomonas humi TaxID=335630 RepID=A0ABP7RLF4_9SPHN
MLARLTLTDFRNHAALDLQPGPGFVCLHGQNGAGKTNILEAVSMLAPGRGLRGSALGEMARSDGPGGWTVAASLDGDINLGTGTLAAVPERRIVRINGAPASANSLGEWLAITWLTPAMDRLFTDSAGSRRRFLDRLVLALDPAHAVRAARYEAAMRARNKLLAEDHWDGEWLLSLERQMEEYGVAVSRARLATILRLQERFDGSAATDFPLPRLTLDKVTPTALAARLAACRSLDAAARRATHGPNTEDLLVTNIAKAQPAARSSTGEQKALLIGLMLAHADLVTEQRGAPPILLLDEVAAHLDPGRRAALFERLQGRGQVWMTATEAALFDGVHGAIMVHVG